MFCQNCGFNNEKDSKFCLKCGTPLLIPQESPEKHNQFYQAEAQPVQPAAPKPKKKRKGLIIGLVSGGVVLLAALAAGYFVFFAGAAVTGEWYSQQQGIVLSFNDGGIVEQIGLAGSYEGEYEYNKGKGKGVITVSGGEDEFTVKGDELTVEATDKDYIFTRAEEKFDSEEFFEECFLGAWSNEELVQVIEIKKRGNLSLFTVSGETEGEYEYDVCDGEGTITLGDQELSFITSEQGIELEDSGVFAKQDEDFDIYDFIAENAVGVAGIWYKTGDRNITLKFSEEHLFIYTVINGGVTNETIGIYDFDEETGEGIILLQQTVKFNVEDGKLYIGEDVFTRYK